MEPPIQRDELELGNLPAASPLRDVQGRLLPGQASINPKGRKPHSHRVRTMARAYTREAIDVLADAMRNAATPDARIKAATALLDRGWGRPAQQLSADISATKVVTVNLGWLNGRSVDNPIDHDAGRDRQAETTLSFEEPK